MPTDSACPAWHAKIPWKSLTFVLLEVLEVSTRAADLGR